MEKTIRLYEILSLLQSRKNPMRAGDIGEILGVSRRTVYRDIQALKAMAFPVDGEAGIGFILRPGAKFSSLALSSEEYETISLGLALLGRTGDEDMLRTAQRVQAKLDKAISEQNIKDNVTLKTSSWNRIPASSLKPEQLRQAIRTQEDLLIDYCDGKGQQTKRQILPLALVYYVDVIVLAAWCELRRAFRHFRLDRINRIDGIQPSGSRKPTRPDIKILLAQWQELRQREWQEFQDNLETSNLSA